MQVGGHESRPGVAGEARCPRALVLLLSRLREQEWLETVQEPRIRRLRCLTKLAAPPAPLVPFAGPYPPRRPHLDHQTCP